MDSVAFGRDGTIYAKDPRNLYAINRDGSLKWTFHLADGDVRPGEAAGFGSIAVGSDGTILSGFLKDIHAIKTDGTRNWTFRTERGSLTSIAVGGDGTVYSTLFDSGRDSTLLAINPDGSRKWTFGPDARVAMSARY